MLEAAEMKLNENRKVDDQLWALDRHKEVDSWLIFMFVAQVALMMLFVVFIDFEIVTVAARNEAARVADASVALTVHIRNALLVVTLGFGLMSALLRRFSVSAIAFNFLLVAIATQFGTFFLSCIAAAIDRENIIAFNQTAETARFAANTRKKLLYFFLFIFFITKIILFLK